MRTSAERSIPPPSHRHGPDSEALANARLAERAHEAAIRALAAARASRDQAIRQAAASGWEPIRIAEACGLPYPVVDEVLADLT